MTTTRKRPPAPANKADQATATIQPVFDAHQHLCMTLAGIDPAQGDARSYTVTVLMAYIAHARAVLDTSPIPRAAEKSLIDLAQALADLDQGAVTPLVKPSAPVKQGKPLDPTVRERRWIARACIDYLMRRDGGLQDDAETNLLALMGSAAEEYERSTLHRDLSRVSKIRPNRQLLDDTALTNCAQTLKTMYAATSCAE